MVFIFLWTPHVTPLRVAQQTMWASIDWASDQEEYGVARKNKGTFLFHNSIPTL